MKHSKLRKYQLPDFLSTTTTTTTTLTQTSPLTLDLHSQVEHPGKDQPHEPSK